MTQFANNQSTAKGGQSSGKRFLEEAQQRFTDVLHECVAGYDGDSVEDYTQTILDEAWPVLRTDLIQSFKNGKKAR